MKKQFLELSTIHQPRGNTAKEIADFVLAEGDEDLFVWCPDVEADFVELPDWFWNVCKFAIQSNCYYIRFTPDGEIYNNLTQFDWE